MPPGVGLHLCGALWPAPRWLQWGADATTLGATHPQGHLAVRTSLQRCGKTQCEPNVKGLCHPPARATTSHRDQVPETPTSLSPFAARSRAQLVLLLELNGMEPSRPPARRRARCPPPAPRPVPVPAVHGTGTLCPKAQGEPRTPVSSSLSPGLGKSLHCARCKRLKGLWFPFRTCLERSHRNKCQEK